MKTARLLLFSMLLLGTAAAFRPWSARPEGPFRAMGHEGRPSARAMAPPPPTVFVAAPPAATPPAEPAGLPSFTFADLGKATRNPDGTYSFPPELAAADGKTTRIRGFMVPYDSLEDMSVFMLMQFSNGCFFCEPPSLNQVLIVHQKKGASKAFVEDPVQITGTFRVWKADSAHPDHQAGFLYVIDDGELEKMKSDTAPAPAAPGHKTPHG